MSYHIPASMCVGVTVKMMHGPINIREMYIYIICRLRDAVRRKIPQIWGANTWSLLYDNAAAHRTVW